MRDIGFYLGQDSLYIANSNSGRNYSFQDYPLEQLGAANEGEELKLEVLINKASREFTIGDKDKIYLVLEDRYFIFRSFIVPVMNRNEIESSIVFEIEKYIPFKIEDMVWNYTYQRLPDARKIIVSFVGMKREVYDKLSQPFSQLGLKLYAIEPSCLCLLRLVRGISMYNKASWFALMDITSSGSYLNFFYRTLPVFSRTLFSAKGESLYETKRVSSTSVLSSDKLAEEARFSLQYFSREFRSYELEKVFVLADKGNDEVIATLNKSVSAEMEYIAPEDILSIPGQELTIGNIKAYGAANFGRSLSSNKFIPFLEDTSTCFVGGSKGLPDFVSVTVASILIILGLSGILLFNLALNNNLKYRESRLKRKEAEITLSDDLKYRKLSEIKNIAEEKDKEVNTLKTQFERFVDISEVTERVGRLITEGLWLGNISIKNSAPDNLEMEISGYVYLDEPGREAGSLDQFITNIRNDEQIKEIFPMIDLLGKGKELLKGINVTRFKIKLY